MRQQGSAFRIISHLRAELIFPMSVNHCVRSSASSSLASCSLVHLTYAFASLYLEKPVICDANTSTIGCSGWDAASAETSQPRDFFGDPYESGSEQVFDLWRLYFAGVRIPNSDNSSMPELVSGCSCLAAPEGSDAKRAATLSLCECRIAV